jgi:hypothetical protein
MANGILNFDPEAVEQDIIDFYGGNAQQIAQPDASYFSEFALPSTRVPVNVPEPQPDAMPVMSNPMPPAFMGASTPPITVNPRAFLNGVPTTNLGSLPREIQDAIDILNRSSVSTRKRKSARNTLDEFNASLTQAEPAPDIPIPDLASQRDVLGAQPSEIEERAMAIAAADPRAMLGGQAAQPEMAAVSTPIDRSLQMRIQELEALNDGRVPNIGFMGMRF